MGRGARAGRALAVLLSAGLLVVTGCSGEPDRPLAAPTSPDSSPTASATTPTSAPAPGSTDAAIGRLLQRRATAVLHHDRSAFLRDVAPGGRAAQAAWFDRIHRLPLAAVSFEPDGYDAAASARDRYVTDVDVSVQLRGFDPEPVPTVHRMVLRRDEGRWRVARDASDPSQVVQAPWDVPGTRTEVLGHVVLVTDRRTRRERVPLLVQLQLARDGDRAVIPKTYGTLDRVVVVALSTTDAFRAEGLGTAEIASLGGVTVPVRGPDEQPMESRVLVAPTTLHRSPRVLRVLLRHELAHVALREYADLPVWAIEGIAEYAAWLGEPRVYVSRSAVAAARQGVDQMPANGLFHTGDASVSYAVAAWSLAWLAREHGADEPFALIAALEKAEAVDHEDVDRVLEDRYGLTADELAQRGSRLIAASF